MVSLCKGIKAMGTSDIAEWDMDFIMRRDIRISDSIRAILSKWNNDYLNISTATNDEEKTSEEDLDRIEEFKKKSRDRI